MATKVKEMSDREEIWKNIPGYDNYEVSDHGRIRSITHIDSMGRVKDGRIKKLKNHRNGYLLVCLNHDEIRLVHRLVVIAFIGEITQGFEVNHKDGDKKNNYIENLELCTKSYNQIHRCHVLKNVPKAQLDAIANCSKKRSRAIRSRVPEGIFDSQYSIGEISSMTGVSKSTLFRMKNGN